MDRLLCELLQSYEKNESKTLKVDFISYLCSINWIM